MNTDTGEVKKFLNDEEVEAAGPQWKAIDPANLTAPVRELLERTGTARISRNSPCPCGSRKRFKRCCMTEATR